MTVGCRDTDLLPKHDAAGKVVDIEGFAFQTMHNGLKVIAGGYYGDWMTEVIRGLNGHHEPQEELLFHHLVRACRPETSIIELGSFWAYYSLWYLTAVPGSRAVCVEADIEHMEVGRRNAECNGLADRILFENAWIGGRRSPAWTGICETTQAPLTLPCLDMRGVMSLVGDAVEMLHMDIQGAETDFIRSMQGLEHMVRFLVVSTHHRSISGSPTTHHDCLGAIESLGGIVLEEHSVEQSFSGDGLIIASFSPSDRNLELPPISRNTSENSLFGAA